MTSDHFLKRIQAHYNDQLPFVAYRKPNKTSLNALLQNNTFLHVTSDYTESGFVFAPFDDSGQSILISISESESLESIYVNSNNIEIPQKKITNNQEHKNDHILLVQKAIDKINEDELKKVVVSRKEELTITEKNPIEIFKRLLDKYESAFVYCWFHPKVGLWLGATPETLLKIEGRQISTMALAGTQEFNGTLEVQWLPKEREEQQIVTDFIVRSLNESVDEIKIFETKTVKAGNLLHLKTDIKGNVKQEASTLKHIIQSLHPTPAVCGLPTALAKQFILSNETYNRDFYTGFLGELNYKVTNSRNSNRRNVENNAYSSIKTVSNLFVNLRCMQLKDDKAVIYIGGGITKDSNPEKEWDEIVNKSEVIKSIL